MESIDDDLEAARRILTEASDANRAAKVRLEALANLGSRNADDFTASDFAAAEAEVQRTDAALSRAAENFRRANETP